MNYEDSKGHFPPLRQEVKFVIYIVLYTVTPKLRENAYVDRAHFTAHKIQIKIY